MLPVSRGQMSNEPISPIGNSTLGADSMVSRNSFHSDFMFLIEQVTGVSSRTIKNHVKAFEEANIIPKLPAPNSFHEDEAVRIMKRLMQNGFRFVAEE